MGSPLLVVSTIEALHSNTVFLPDNIEHGTAQHSTALSHEYHEQTDCGVLHRQGQRHD